MNKIAFYLRLIFKTDLKLKKNWEELIKIRLKGGVI